MKTFAKNHPKALRALACYALGLLVLLAWHLGGFLYNRVLRANGTLETQVLTVDDFTLVNLVELDDGRLVSTTADPQLVLKDASLRADSVCLRMTVMEGDGYVNPAMVTAYYGKPGEGHSPRKMAYARWVQDPDQPPEISSIWFVQRMELPAAGAANLRIDPDVEAGRIYEIHSIGINGTRGFASFMAPTAGELWLLAVLPGFLACALALVPPGFGVRFVRRRKGGA